MFNYGTVLKLDRHDTPEIIETEFTKMKASGLDTVCIWPATFWWEEKRDGYPFNTGKAILKIAEKTGLKVIMELAGQITALESIPDFMMKPEYLTTEFGGAPSEQKFVYPYLNYYHPEVKKLITERYADAAKAYKNSPALLGYDIFNETMWRSFDEYSTEAFRRFLEEKYGNISALNDAWERTFGDFSEVDYTHWTWMSSQPEIDYKAFQRKSIGVFLREWKSAIKEVDPEHTVFGDNIFSELFCGYETGQDDWELSASVDEPGSSFYPRQETGDFPVWMRRQLLDQFRTAADGKPFWIAEMQVHTQAMFCPHTSVEPKTLRMWTYEAVSAGARGIIHWMWRPFSDGLQTGGRGLTDYKGRATERLKEVEKLSPILKKLDGVMPVSDKVAIVCDTETRDAQNVYTRNYHFADDEFYVHSVNGAYRALLEYGIHADVIRPWQVGNKYKVIIVTAGIRLTKALSDALKKFVNAGGTLITDGRFGFTGEDSKVFTALPGGDMNELVGNDFYDVRPADGGYEIDGEYFLSQFEEMIIKSETSSVIAKYKDGSPAVTEKSQPSGGKVISFSDYLFYGIYNNPRKINYLKKVLETAGVPFVRRSGDVVLRLTENENGKYLFAFNYGDGTATAEAGFTAKSLKNIENGKNVSPENITLESGECAVFSVEE